MSFFYTLAKEAYGPALYSRLKKNEELKTVIISSSHKYLDDKKSCPLLQQPKIK